MGQSIFDRDRASISPPAQPCHRARQTECVVRGWRTGRPGGAVFPLLLRAALPSPARLGSYLCLVSACSLPAATPPSKSEEQRRLLSLCARALRASQAKQCMARSNGAKQCGWRRSKVRGVAESNGCVIRSEHEYAGYRYTS